MVVLLDVICVIVNHRSYFKHLTKNLLKKTKTLTLKKDGIISAKMLTHFLVLAYKNKQQTVNCHIFFLTYTTSLHYFRQQFKWI